MAAGSHETKAKLTGGDFLNQIFDSSRIGPIAYYLRVVDTAKVDVLYLFAGVLHLKSPFDCHTVTGPCPTWSPLLAPGRRGIRT
jgi:hypothetical protein